MAKTAQAALLAVSGFNHYTSAYFEWKAGYDLIIASFHDDTAKVRADNADAALRLEMMDDVVNHMNDCIIELTDEHYPCDADGIWHDVTEEANENKAPSIVVDNDLPITDGENTTENLQPVDDGDGGTTFEIEHNTAAIA